MLSVQDSFSKLHTNLSESKYHLSFGVGIVDQTIFQGVEYFPNGNIQGPGNPIVVQIIASKK